MPSTLSGKIYYEILYWGGGHALQFTWTLLMLAAWLWLVINFNHSKLEFKRIVQQ